jgi:hypothetical protein
MTKTKFNCIRTAHALQKWKLDLLTTLNNSFYAKSRTGYNNGRNINCLQTSVGLSDPNICRRKVSCSTVVRYKDRILVRKVPTTFYSLLTQQSMFACVKILSLKALYNTEFYDPPNVNIYEYNHRTIILLLFQFEKLFTHSEYEFTWNFIYNESTLDDF